MNSFNSYDVCMAIFLGMCVLAAWGNYHFTDDNKHSEDTCL